MTYRSRGQLVLAAICLLGTVVDQPLRAQTNYTWIGGTGSWNSGSNWDLGLPPEAFYEETATINNGGTATLNTAATNSTAYDPGTGVVPGAVGGLVLGQNVGDSGTLRITSGGVINFVDSTGAATGIANIGLNGTGVLEVQGGGTFSTTSLDVNTGSQVIIGGGTGAASVASTGNAWFGGTTVVRGPNHNFSVNGNLYLEGSGIYNPVISTGTHTTVRVSGTTTLGGALKVDFAPGYTPTVGSSWNLVDASAISGNFANAPDRIVPVQGEHAPDVGSSYRLRTVSGGTNGTLLQLSLDKNLVLRVNRDTGALSIVNPLGASVPALDSYTITSGAGSLLSGYKGISGAPAGDTGWEKAPQNSTTGLAEFKATGGLNVSSSSTNLSLGTGFSKTAVASQGLGVKGEDLVFSYHTVGGAVTLGQIEYIGTPYLNDLVLTVNTTSGQATLKNDTLQSIAIDGYSIVSATEDLVGTGWTGLSGSFPNWLKTPASATALSETNSAGPSTLTAGQSVSLGTIGDFSSQEAQDGLAMKFLLGNEQTFRLATVQFVSGTQAGDFDGDGDVDGRDFLRWQRGQSPNPRSATDLAAWKSNYGAGSLAAAATAIPEPSTLGLTLLGSVAMLTRRRRHSLSVETRKDNLKMNRFRTLNSTRSIGVVAALACLAMLHASVASAQILGLNFAASDPDTATSSLASTDIAGVVPVANWNNLQGNVGTGVTGLFYDNNGTATASSATLSWNSPNTWRSGTNNAFPVGPDRNLLSGYLDTGDTTATGITITLSGIDAALRTNFYDVYVYFVSDSNANRGGGYRVSDGNTSYLRYGSSMGSPSAYVQDPGTDIDISVDGNYLRYRGLSGSALTITSDTTLTSPNGFRAPINAVEIVATNVGPGDADENGVVDINDYNLIRGNLETSVAFYTNGDVDGNGYVDLNDFALWRDVAPLTALVAAGLAVPEPSTAVLAGALLFGFLGRGRRRHRSANESPAATVMTTVSVKNTPMNKCLPCLVALLGVCCSASLSRAAATMTLGTTAPTPGTYDQYIFGDDAVVPGGTTPGGGTYNSQSFSDNGGPPGQIFTTPASASPSLPAFQLNTIWLKGAEASSANFGGFSESTTWSVRISEVNGTVLTPLKTINGITSATGITGNEWYTWTFTGGELQNLQANKQYAFDLYSTAGYLGFDADTSDSYTGGTAFNSGGGSRSFDGLTTGNLATHGYDRTFLVGLSPSVLIGPGDVDGDGDTDLVDYGIIKTNFFLATGATRGQGDLTGDGRVLLDDFVVWKNNAAGSLVAQVSVPEPGSLALLVAAGALGCLRRTRGRQND